MKSIYIYNTKYVIFMLLLELRKEMKTAFLGNLFRSKSRPSVLPKFFIFNKYVRSIAIFVDLFAILCFIFQGIASIEAIVSKNNNTWSTSTDKSETGFLREKSQALWWGDGNRLEDRTQLPWCYPVCPVWGLLRLAFHDYIIELSKFLCIRSSVIATFYRMGFKKKLIRWNTEHSERGMQQGAAELSFHLSALCCPHPQHRNLSSMWCSISKPMK